MDFVICAYLNSFSVFDALPLAGEYLGLICWSCVMILIFIVLPAAVIILIARKPEADELNTEKSKDTWGVLYDDLRTENRL